jgi:malate permease and related proteins
VSNIILLFACLALGLVLGWSKRFPEGAHLALNAFILHVSLPALILLQVHAIHLRPDLLYSVAMPWVLFSMGCVFFWLLGRALRFTPATTGGLMLVGGLANTSFVGLPMIQAFYGSGGIATGILIDQLGTYLVLSTLGITIAAFYSHGPTRAGAILQRIVGFPPLLALVVALALLRVEYPTWVADVLRSLGGTLAPLALVSVGLQLHLDQLRGNVSALATGLTFKLLIGPALLALVYVWWLHADGPTMRITLFEAAMGPQIGAAIVAIQHGLNPTLITLMVGIGITLSFATLPAWWYLLQGIC